LLAKKQRSTQQLSFAQAMQVELIAGTFFVLSLAAFVLLFLMVSTNPHLAHLKFTTEFGTIVWNFIRHVGILRPLLIIAAGVMLFRLGLRLRTRNVTAARWGRQILAWLLAAVGVWGVYVALSGIGAAEGDIDAKLILDDMAPMLLIEAFLLGGYWLLRHNRLLFKGDELAVTQATRSAWNLLTPTVIIFVLIAISPLEQVFIHSLTNERFASSEEVEYVGLDNYVNLLGMRLDIIPCTADPAGGCLTEVLEDGSIQKVYPSLRDHLGDQYREVRRNYRDVTTLDMFDRRYVLSARDPDFFNATVSSLIYTFLAIFFQLTIGIVMALVLAARLRGIGMLRLAMLVPMAIPTLIATQFWDVMLRPDQTGILNDILLRLHLVNEAQGWLTNPALQIPSLVLVIVWKETPTFALLILPGLLSISPEIYQAASIDGANRWQQFYRITLPMLRPVIGVALILRTMITLRVFDVFEIMVQRQAAPRFSMATYAHETLIQKQQLGYSSAISVTIFVIALLFTIFYMRSLRVDEV
jgi:trehalose/maltose transport system permease protein